MERNREWWFQFDVDAWRRSPKIRLLDAVARGAWLEMICVMFVEDTYFVEGTPGDIARMCSLSPDEIASAVEQLERHGAADVERDGEVLTVISRRRKEAHDKRESDRERKRKQRGADEEPEQTARPVPKEIRITKGATGEYEGDDFVAAYTHYTGYKPRLTHQEQIKLRVKNLPMWCATLGQWMDAGYKPQNVVSVIEKYESDIMPKAQKTIQDKADPNRSAPRRPKVCRICGASGSDVGGPIGDQRCGKVACLAAPPP